MRCSKLTFDWPTATKTKAKDPFRKAGVVDTRMARGRGSYKGRGTRSVIRQVIQVGFQNATALSVRSNNRSRTVIDFCRVKPSRRSARPVSLTPEGMSPGHIPARLACLTSRRGPPPSLSLFPPPTRERERGAFLRLQRSAPLTSTQIPSWLPTPETNALFLF